MWNGTDSFFLREFQNFSLFIRVTSALVTDRVLRLFLFLPEYVVPSHRAARWGHVPAKGAWEVHSPLPGLAPKISHEVLHSPSPYCPNPHSGLAGRVLPGGLCSHRSKQLVSQPLSRAAWQRHPHRAWCKQEINLYCVLALRCKGLFILRERPSVAKEISQNIDNGLEALYLLKSPSSRNIFNKEQSIALQRTSKLLHFFEILLKVEAAGSREERQKERERKRKR